MAKLPEIGSFLYTSWGYDQTQVDFYKVVGHTPKCVRVQRWTKRDVSTGGNPHESVIPAKHPAEHYHYDRETGESTTTEMPTFVVRPAKGGDYFTIDGHWAGVWDGKPQYQTGHGYGH